MKNHHYGTKLQIAYRHIALGHKYVFKTIFEQIDPEKENFIIHCHHGRDRTGCVVALFGLLIDEDIENIQRDYLKSEIGTDIENLNAFFEIIYRSGNVENFLFECGINHERINYWKMQLKNEN
jgi:hypothetical protein